MFASQKAEFSQQDADSPAPKILFSRFMLPDMTEHACQVAELDVDGATFVTEADVPAGVRLVTYIDEVGRLEASVSAQTETGLRVRFNLNEARRERLLKRLQELASGDSQGHSQRRHERFAPTNSKSHITLPDSRIYDCEVIDISLSGAAIKLAVMPALGTQVKLGKMQARVVRHHETGIALEFVRQLDPSNFAPQLKK